MQIMTISTLLILAVAALAALGILAGAGLSGWNGWLALRRLAIEQHRAGDARPASAAGSRIELADLKERIRKLEAIAAGIDP